MTPTCVASSTNSFIYKSPAMILIIIVSGDTNRVVRICLFMGCVFPNLPFRLIPVLNGMALLAAVPFI